MQIKNLEPLAYTITILTTQGLDATDGEWAWTTYTQQRCEFEVVGNRDTPAAWSRYSEQTSQPAHRQNTSNRTGDRRNLSFVISKRSCIELSRSRFLSLARSDAGLALTADGQQTPRPNSIFRVFAALLAVLCKQPYFSTHSFISRLRPKTRRTEYKAQAWPLLQCWPPSQRHGATSTGPSCANAPICPIRLLPTT